MSLSSDSIFKAADSVQVKLNTLYNVDTTPENLLAAEYMPFCAIPNIVDIIILSDALTIHQESILGTSGTEYFNICFRIWWSFFLNDMYSPNFFEKNIYEAQVMFPIRVADSIP